MILISTANGKVGSEIVEQLLAKGTSIRVGAHNVAKAEANFPGVNIVHFDYNDTNSIKAALEGVDTVYLASPGDFPSDPEKNVVDLAKAAGVKRVVKLSAMGVEADDSIPLRQVENHIEASGLEYTILRPTWFMQNYSTGMAGSVKSGTIYEPAEQAKTGFIDARDIAAVAVKTLTETGHNGQAYALTGSESLDRNAVAAKLSSALGKTIQYVPINDEQFRGAMQNVLSPSYLELMSSLYAGVRAGWSDATTDTVKKVLGRDPISFDQFAVDHKDIWL
jgi:uncharacterized protein YbjT (DUF2867 family)